ncbi:hypothetical protein Dthio_PD1268 [Desulfonatronospira thiodismutans ASO3-1]|uniref:DUF4351 domain-containing protein n=1 Tax=Desulfonatronospira thiodismutans ASO3-1 TaxID=555779 RepID=D6STB3_9BACT|nr:hypothetical protein [Desulfonatronospira thiodismutans]EFI33929.1 hypothetical protein Dthio_PD1268 [Desulfonatronospira thiodismutans ASO3-1]
MEYLPLEGWKPTKVSDLVDLPSDDFTIFIPDFNFLLYDAVNDDLEDYDFDETLKALFTLWRYSGSPEFMQGVQKAFQLIKKVDPKARLLDFVQMILHYLEVTRDEKEYIDIKKIAETEIDEGEEYMGTIAEMFRREGDERTEQRFLQEKPIWEKQSELKTTQEMLVKSLKMRFDLVKPNIKEQIRFIQDVDTLNDLFEMSFKCSSIEEFTDLLEKVTEN